jgi:hypothetical protein
MSSTNQSDPRQNERGRQKKENYDEKETSKAVNTATTKVGEIPILRYQTGSSSNFVMFRERLSEACKQEYGKLGTLIDTGEYPTRPRPVPVPTSASVPNDIAEYEYKERLKDFIRRTQGDEDNKIKLYQTIWTHLSMESRDKVKEQANWSEIRANDDAKLLWKAILATHLAGQGGIEVIDQRNVRNQYMRDRQGTSESIVSWYERYANRLEMMKTLKCAEIDDKMQSADFIEKLDNNRFADFKVLLENNVSLKIFEYPDTLVKAYEMASRHKVVNQSNKQIYASTFNTITTNSNNTNKNKKFNKKGMKKGWKLSNAIANHVESSSNNVTNNDNKVSSTSSLSAASGRRGPSPNATCSICNSPEHWRKDCPRAKQAADSAKRSVGNVRENTTLTQIQQQNDTNYSSFMMFDECNDMIPEVTPVGEVGVPAQHLLPTWYKNTDMNVVILDNGATGSVFKNKELLTNLRKKKIPVNFHGVGGSIEVTMEGDFGAYGVVSYSPKSIANILSQSTIAMKSHVQYVSKKNDAGYYIITLNDKTQHKYIHKHGLYVRYMNDNNVYLNTVEANQKMYTKREADGAENARRRCE